MQVINSPPKGIKQIRMDIKQIIIDAYIKGAMPSDQDKDEIKYWAEGYAATKIKELEQSKSSETTDELIKDIIQGAEDFKNHHDKPYDNNTLRNCLIELRNKIESSEGEGKEELKKEAKEMMNLSYIKKIDKTPPYMKKQLILITWAKKMAEMVLNDKLNPS